MALWLLARGEVVLDIPTTATARVRELLRGGRRKNDRIDAAAAASVATLQGDARQFYPESTADSLALLDERRVNLSHSRTRAVNRLHALLRELVAGGAPTSLTPVRATGALRGLRPRTGPDRIRVELAKELFADIRRFDEHLAANAAHPTLGGVFAGCGSRTQASLVLRRLSAEGRAQMARRSFVMLDPGRAVHSLALGPFSGAVGA